MWELAFTLVDELKGSSNETIATKYRKVHKKLDACVNQDKEQPFMKLAKKCGMKSFLGETGTSHHNYDFRLPDDTALADTKHTFCSHGSADTMPPKAKKKILKCIVRIMEYDKSLQDPEA